MSLEESYINERLDHLGIVAGVCQEIGLAAWLDARDPTHRQQTGRALAGREDQGRDARVSTARGAPWIGCMCTIPPGCLLALPDKHDRSLA
jgi:hypothetical protein